MLNIIQLKKLKALFLPVVGLMTVALIVLTGCSSDGGEKKKPAPAPKPVFDCVYPNTEVQAPGWVCDEPVPGIEVSAVGVSEKSAAGISYMKDIAALDARGRLASQMEVQVQKMVKKYLGTTGVGSSETVDAAAESATKSITNQTLYGSKIYKTRTGPNGRLFVLVGLDSDNVRKIAETSARTSMNNQKALWQQFKAQKSFDEMAAEIAKQQVQ